MVDELDGPDSPSTSRRNARSRMFNMNFRRQTSNEYGRKSDVNERNDGDTVKSRLLSAWNNVKFGKNAMFQNSKKYFCDDIRPISLLTHCFWITY